MISIFVEKKLSVTVPSVNESSPPPTMVLHGQLEVSKSDSDTCGHNVEDEENQAQDSIECVVGVSPDTAVDVEQLNVNSTEGEETSHEHLEGKSAVPVYPINHEIKYSQFIRNSQGRLHTMGWEEFREGNS